MQWGHQLLNNKRAAVLLSPATTSTLRSIAISNMNRKEFIGVWILQILKIRTYICILYWYRVSYIVYRAFCIDSLFVLSWHRRKSWMNDMSAVVWKSIVLTLFPQMNPLSLCQYIKARSLYCSSSRVVHPVVVIQKEYIFCQLLQQRLMLMAEYCASSILRPMLTCWNLPSSSRSVGFGRFSFCRWCDRKWVGCHPQYSD